MQIKTIVVDLDRTLLHTDKTISPYTAAVFKECKKPGYGDPGGNCPTSAHNSSLLRMGGF